MLGWIYKRLAILSFALNLLLVARVLMPSTNPAIDPNQVQQLLDIVNDPVKISQRKFSDLRHQFDLLARVNPNGSGNETERELISTCPEAFMGTTFGYPLYDVGFQTLECGKRVLIEYLVTFIIDGHWNKIGEHLPTILTGLKAHFSSVSVVIVRPNDSKVHDPMYINRLFPGMKVISTRLDSNLFKDLVEVVFTPYVLVIRETSNITQDLNLVRMIRELEEQRVHLVGGALRDERGFWTINCHQLTYRAYTMEFQPGYYRSQGECLRCDYFQGSFLAKTRDLSRFKARLKFPHQLQDLDLAVRAKYNFHAKILVCPDIMTEWVTPPNLTRSLALKLAREYQCYRLKLPSGQVFGFSDSDFPEFCPFRSGTMVFPPCAKTLLHIMGILFDVCASTDSSCQLQEGSLLGAVKLQNVLPWERDADIMVLSDHFPRFLAGLEALIDFPGNIIIVNQPACQSQTESCSGGQAKIRLRHWIIEIFGQKAVGSDSGKSTRIQMEGNLSFPVSRNPGRHVRNRYGTDVYKHVEHWLSLGGMSSSWDQYKFSNQFGLCQSAWKFHCLQNFDADGNIQFRDLLPP